MMLNMARRVLRRPQTAAAQHDVCAQPEEEFEVSRTPIRQALQRLEFQRLVDIRDGIGTIVTGVDFHALRNVYELRLRITGLIGDF